MQVYKNGGDKAKEAIKDELKMLVQEKVFEKVQEPTMEQMRDALMMHCFVVEKRDGRIKARAVADGRSQQMYTEEETTSPTVKLESIILNAFVDVHEGRSIATVDIKGAFLKAKVLVNLMLMVKITGELASLMCEINHDMKCNEQGVLNLKCVKALYGHIEVARLFYDDLDNMIQKKMNFIQNQYDPCVCNKLDGDEKVMIRVHVNDLKISSKSKDRINEVIGELRSAYEEITIHFWR